MKNKHRKVQIVEEIVIIILLALVVILAVDLKKTKTAMNELLTNEPATEEVAVIEPEEEPQEENTEQPATEEVVRPPEETTVSVNEVVAEEVTASGNSVVNWIENYPQTTVQMPLSERVKLYSSYDDTMATNARDKEIIANSTVDFSTGALPITSSALYIITAISWRVI